MKIPAFLPFVAALVCASVSPAQDSEKPVAEMREKMQKMKREMGELRAAGRQDEAKQLEERMREEMGKQMSKRGPMEKKVEMVNPGEKPERMQHIAEAIKHLRAAGLNEPAERIEQMAREMQKAEGREREQAGPGEGMEQMQQQIHRAMRDAQEQTQRALRETHEQMAKMARAIEELREQVGKREKHD